MGDNDLFRQETGDIRPIAQDKAVVGKKASAPADFEVRREAAVTVKQDDNYLTGNVIKQVGPDEIVSFKRPGIQEGVFKKLRQGRYSMEARLDLHRMTIETARRALFEFVRDCMEYELRTVMLLHGKGDRAHGKGDRVHGKGDRSPDTQAVLKSHTVFWLEEIPDVMAFHSAQKHHGGTGALYVLLRKSEMAKSINRERHGVRS